MTNLQIEKELESAVRSERKCTNKVLELINLAWSRRAYVDAGYPTMFEWLTKGLKYSNAAAQRRIDAARMLKAVPQARLKLESGEISLTNMATAQRVSKAYEKSTGTPVSPALKASAIERLKGKSGVQAEQCLLAMFPEAAGALPRDRREAVDADTVRLSFNIKNDVDECLMRAKEILSHRLPGASDAEVIAYALNFLLDRLDPLRARERSKTVSNAPDLTRSASAAEANPPSPPTRPHRKKIPSSIKRLVYRRDNGCCSFRNPVTGKLCGSRYLLEIDHLVPKALGGTDEPENLRLLCREHNMRAAENSFGEGAIGRFRKQ